MIKKEVNKQNIDFFKKSSLNLSNAQIIVLQGGEEQC